MKIRSIAILTSAMIVLSGLFVGPPASAAERSPNTIDLASSSVTMMNPMTFGEVVAIPADDPTPSSSTDVGPLREPAGKYYYNCVNTNGTSYFLATGAALSTCKGSYLQVYINGVQIRTISLTTAGTVSNPNAITIDCAVAVIGGIIVVMTPTGTIGWVLSAAVGGISLLRGCKA